VGWILTISKKIISEGKIFNGTYWMISTQKAYFSKTFTLK